MSYDVSEASFKLIADTGVPGTWSMVGTHPNWPFPVAFVWFRYSLDNKRLEVLNSFVTDGIRRNGFRTRAQSEIFKMFGDIDRIETQLGSESGTKWMEAVGYKQNKSGLWGITRRQFERSTQNETFRHTQGQ